jgi:hypothetical protein
MSLTSRELTVRNGTNVSAAEAELLCGGACS